MSSRLPAVNYIVQSGIPELLKFIRYTRLLPGIEHHLRRDETAFIQSRKIYIQIP